MRTNMRVDALSALLSRSRSADGHCSPLPRGSRQFLSEAVQNCHAVPSLPGACIASGSPDSIVLTLRQRSTGGTLLFYVFSLITIPRFFCYSGGCGIVGTRSVVQAPVVNP